MLFSVVCFGCGSEATSIMTGSFISSWFMGKELSFGFGITTASASIGCVIANWTLPLLYDVDNSIKYPFLFGFLLFIFGWLASCFACQIDRFSEKKDK